MPTFQLNALKCWQKIYQRTLFSVSVGAVYAIYRSKSD